MPIRITGMNSGLDTDAIIQELVSAYRSKGDKIKKQQTKLSWTQDKWKALNTKVVKLYKSLDNLRFTAGYNMKKTSVSDTTKATITAGDKAVNGSQTLKIKSTAKSGYLTGGQIADKSKGRKATLADLGYASGSSDPALETGTYRISGNGVTKDIEVNGNTTIADFVDQLNNSGTGVQASYDETNKRLFISSKSTGKDADFTLLALDAKGADALNAFGVNVESATSSAEAAKWMEYYNTSGAPGAVDTNKLEADVRALAALKADQAKLTGEVEGYQMQNSKLTGALGYIQAKKDNDTAAIQAYEADATNQQFIDEVAAAGDLDVLAKTYTDTIEANNNSITANSEKMQENAENMKQYATIDSAKVTGQMANAPASDPDIDAYVQTLTERVEYFNNNYTLNATTGKYELNADQRSNGANKVNGMDAEIELNGAQFSSSSNTFNINGLTIQALAETDSDIMITTATDTQGLYDKIKDFLTEYNSIISEMSSLYNADSAKGYEPLLSEEKEALSDSEVADWEKKIKDSLLRRDGNLSTLITSMTSAMSSSVEIGGKKYNLASLGIKTEGYFNTTAATRYMFHIDGDPDDETSSANGDKLMSMLNSDPDKVIDIIKGVTNKLYDNLSKQMKPTTLRTYQTIYNDKAMATSYSDYTKKISAWEEKVARIEDSYYKKFAAMETALAKLQSQQSSLAGLLG
ncbi:MAG: flagellar filament capping protein FliD [Eubacterium sp.]|nr:flagellar filament capping protein FliD [Eubacterium sp.]